MQQPLDATDLALRQVMACGDESEWSELDYIENYVVMWVLREQCSRAARGLMMMSHKKEASAFVRLAMCIDGAFKEFGGHPSLFNRFVSGQGSADHEPPMVVFTRLRDTVYDRLVHPQQQQQQHSSSNGM